MKFQSKKGQEVFEYLERMVEQQVVDMRLAAGRAVDSGVALSEVSKIDIPALQFSMMVTAVETAHRVDIAERRLRSDVMSSPSGDMKQKAETLAASTGRTVVEKGVRDRG